MTASFGGGNDRVAIRWISMGTGISVVFLLASAIWTLLTVRSVVDASRAACAGHRRDRASMVVGSALPFGHSQPRLHDRQ